MRKIIFSIICVVVCTWCIQAVDTPTQRRSDANMIGHILDKTTGEHLTFINVIVRGTTIGTVTDNTGHYFLKDLPVGKQTIEFKSLGYKTISVEVELESGKTLELNVDMEEDRVSLDAVVVSANRGETTRRLAPHIGKCAGRSGF